MRSHLYYAAQLIQLLVLLAVVSTTHYISSTWGAWLVRRCVGTAEAIWSELSDRSRILHSENELARQFPAEGRKYKTMFVMVFLGCAAGGAVPSLGALLVQPADLLNEQDQGVPCRRLHMLPLHRA